MDRYFYSVEPDTEHGKVIHFLANVYFNDVDTSKTDHRIAEWKGEYLTIIEVQKLLADNYLFDFINERIRSLDDLTQVQATNICDMCKGNLLHIKDISIDTPYGEYYFDA